MTRHALLLSDVYFPRVNGVSTSLQTFRADLREAGVVTTLIAPEYAATLEASRIEEGGDARIVRIRSRAVPLDPEDRLMDRRALERAVGAVPDVPYEVVHIQTPFLAHYAGVAAARRWGVPVLATCHTNFEDYLHHYLPLLPHAAGRYLARRLMRSHARGAGGRLRSRSGARRRGRVRRGGDPRAHRRDARSPPFRVATVNA